VAKVYIVSFRTHDDRRPSKFIVLAESMKSAIKMAWEHAGSDFRLRFDKSTAQAEQMKRGRCGCSKLAIEFFLTGGLPFAGLYPTMPNSLLTG
jgi:hypothetical protein